MIKLKIDKGLNKTIKELQYKAWVMKNMMNAKAEKLKRIKEKSRTNYRKYHYKVGTG